jgi:hypothetical protein
MRTHRHIWVLAAAALVAGCADYGAPDEVLFGTAVYSQPKAGFDPQALGTYYLFTDAVVLGDTATITPQTINLLLPQYAGILDAIDANMQGYGYRKTLILPPPAGEPGTATIRVAIMSGTAAVYYPGYWCDYWVYYSCYPNYSYAGSYKFGTVFVDMGGFRTDGKLDSEWIGAVYGVATGVPYDTPRIVDGINRAYAQSPYLRR